MLVSGATAGAVMLSTVLVTGWLAAGLGPVAFAVYALARRALSLVSAVSPGPVGVALARALAMAPHERDRQAHLWAGTLLALLPNLAILAVGAAFPGYWAELLLSDARYAPELLATLALILATTVFSLVLARLRGRQQIRRANLWQLWVLALGPLLVAGALAKRGSVAMILLGMAAVTATALLPLAAWLARSLRDGIRRSALRVPLRDQLRYSLPRVPGAAALGGLLAIGPFLAPYFGDLREAGYLVAGQSVLRVVEAATAGFGLVVLPKVSVLHARRQQQFLRERVEDLVGLVAHVGLFAACQLAIWAPEIVHVWLGRAYAEAVPLIRVLLMALVPYLAYTLFRSVIDGIEERPVNTLNLYAALGCTAALSLGLGLAGWGAFGLALASAAGFVVLGGLTLAYLHRRQDVGLGQAAIPAALGLNLAGALLTLGARQALVGRLGDPALLVAGLGVSTLLLLGYLLLLRRLGLRWVVEIEARLVRRRGTR